MLNLTISGFVGNDSEIKTYKGKMALSFSVASTKKINRDGVKEENTTWVNCTIWTQAAEKLQQYLTKGTPVVCNGECELREYTKKDGTKGSSLNLNVRDFNFTGKTDKVTSEDIGRELPF